MGSLDEIFSDFSGHSLWTRYFQIFLDIVSGRVIVVYNIKEYRGIHINGLGAGYSLPLTCIYSEHDRVSLRTSLSHAVLFLRHRIFFERILTSAVKSINRHKVFTKVVDNGRKIDN